MHELTNTKKEHLLNKSEKWGSEVNELKDTVRIVHCQVSKAKEAVRQKDDKLKVAFYEETQLDGVVDKI